MTKFKLSLGLAATFLAVAVNKNGKALDVPVDSASLSFDALPAGVTVTQLDATHFQVEATEEAQLTVTIAGTVAGSPYTGAAEFDAEDTDTTVAGIALVPAG